MSELKEKIRPRIWKIEDGEFVEVKVSQLPAEKVILSDEELEKLMWYGYMSCFFDGQKPP